MAPNRPNLVALRTERKRCVDLLSEAFSTDLFDIDEFERRVDLAHRAETVQALVSLREDIAGLELAVDPESSTALVPVADAERQQALALAQPESGWCVGIMGGAERKGQWRVPKKMRVAAVMGGAAIDFREAIFAPGVSSVHLLACMGGIEIIVPPSIAVECNGMGIMGGFESMERCPVIPDPDQPLLRISGAAVMGGFEITTRLVGESARDARKRRKREQKAQKKQLGSGE
ncbi:MAG: DUF1707 domain-containing protein [Myxococcales bacterium]|nr:DUF1707 domain-containing protein [Myxococcales bacterium]